MNKLGLNLTILLGIVIGILLILNIRFIHQQNKWSPIDEFAHMDYIIQLSHGQFPKFSNFISHEIIEYSEGHPEKISEISRNDLQLKGMTAYSYESHHPPIYYLILSAPYKILSYFNVDLFAKLKILRLISFGLFFAGLLVVIPLFKEISKLGFHLPLSYSLSCVIFGLLVATHQRYGLGNNMLSPLVVNLCVLFLLQSFRKSFHRYFCMSLIFLGLALLTSYANILILPFLYLTSTIKIIKRLRLKTILVSIIIISTFVGFYFLWKHLSTPVKGIADFLYIVLGLLMPPGIFNYRSFLELLLVDTFTLSFINQGIILDRVFVCFVVANLLISLFFIGRIYKKMKWLLVAYMLLLIMIISGYILNKHVGGVNWYAFRHFIGLIPILFICASSFVLIPFNHRK